MILYDKNKLEVHKQRMREIERKLMGWTLKLKHDESQQEGSEKEGKQK